MTPQDVADTCYGLAWLAESDGHPDRAASLRVVAATHLELYRLTCEYMTALDASIANTETLLNEGERPCH
jgi:hypothetical protein